MQILVWKEAHTVILPLLEKKVYVLLLLKKSINNLFVLQGRHLVWSYLKTLIIISSFTWKFILENSLSLDLKPSILKMRQDIEWKNNLIC